MTLIKSAYLGELRTRALHEKSGTEIITDAPTDNHGKGEAFSPTDLVCAALGSCMSTIMGIHARKHGIELPLFEYTTQKFMQAGPRKIGKVAIYFSFAENSLSNEEKEILKNAALNCPVALSMHPDIEQDISFSF